MKFREWLPLISIVIGVFIFNVSEFVPIGLLTNIADDFEVSESTAGLIISVYAWAVAILSVPIMLVLRKMEFRKMMLLCTGIFVFFQFLSGVSVSYGMLMASRLGVALSHAIFWSIAPNLAVRVVDENNKRVALSLVAGGTSVAMIAGLPLGRIIGLAMGWRMTFMIIVVAGLATLFLQIAVFPRLDNPGTFTARRLPEILRNRTLVCIYIVLAIFITGCYTGYSYIEPFIGQVLGLGQGEITAALVVFGCSGFIGGYLFAKLYDRSRFAFLIFAILGTTCSLFLLNNGSGVGALIFPVCALWGICMTCFNTSFQNETIWASPDDTRSVSMAMFSGIYNVGIAMGSLVGGRVIDTISIDSIGFVGGGIAFIGLVLAVTVLIPTLKRSGTAN